MTDADTHVRWMSNDNGDVTDMNYTFTPADNLPNTSKAPQELDRGSIRTRPEYLLQKGEGADGTPDHIFHKSFHRGRPSGVGCKLLSPNSLGEINGYIGEAAVVYHNDTEENPVVSVTDIPANTKVYVRAYSMNGYPSTAVRQWRRRCL